LLKKLITICASENKWQLNAVLPTISIVGQKVGQEVTCDTMWYNVVLTRTTLYQQCCLFTDQSTLPQTKMNEMDRQHQKYKVKNPCTEYAGVIPSTSRCQCHYRLMPQHRGTFGWYLEKEFICR